MAESKLYELGYAPKDLELKVLEPIVPPNLNKFFDVIYDTKDSGKNTVINWDTDVDGVFAGYTSYKILSKILDEDKIYNYINETKVHGITLKFIDFCNDNNIETVIIVDAGTNDVEEVKTLNDMGITVIVIDHHDKVEEYYSDKFVLINSNDMPIGNKVSGAYMTNEVMKRLYENYYKTTLADYDELAIISIVSDICERDEYNKNAILHFIYGKCRPTDLINLFRNKYTYNSIPFIISLTSKINSILRYYGTKVVMELMLGNEVDFKKLIDNTKETKILSEKIVNEIIENSTVYEMSNLMLLIIDKDSGESEIKFRNYLSIIASKVSRSKGKLCMVLASKEVNFEVDNKDYIYCYSVRDPFNRNSRDKAIECNITAKGHPQAWGGLLQENFVSDIFKLNDSLSEYETLISSNRVYKTRSISNEISSLKEIMLPLSIWNTIQSDEDKIKIEFELDGNISKIGKIKKIKHGSLEFKSFEDNLSVGDTVYCVPEYNRSVDLLITK